MPLRGGATDKYGNRYEGRWTAFCMAQILDESACSIRLEPHEKGFEFWLRKKDRIEYHQIKRQKSRGVGWTLRNLEKEDILQNIGNKLGAAQNNDCVFISTQSASELDNLADKAALSRNRVIFQLFQYHDRTHLPIATKVWYNFVSHTKIVVST
jgi:hypothetical protein